MYTNVTTELFKCSMTKTSCQQRRGSFCFKSSEQSLNLENQGRKVQDDNGAQHEDDENQTHISRHGSGHPGVGCADLLDFGGC